MKSIEEERRFATRIGKIFLQARSDKDVDPQDRIMNSVEELCILIDQSKKTGRFIVLTQGTFDMIHIGHARYLREAKKNGDLLIVGLDDDVKARSRKGENRPVVPEGERAEMLGHLRYVDAVVYKHAEDPRWDLVKLVRPNTLIAVEGTYSESELIELGELCDKVVVLPRQAETSTSNKVRKLVLDGAETLTRILREKIPEFVESVYHELKRENGV